MMILTVLAVVGLIAAIPTSDRRSELNQKYSDVIGAYHGKSVLFLMCFPVASI